MTDVVSIEPQPPGLTAYLWAVEGAAALATAGWLAALVATPLLAPAQWLVALGLLAALFLLVRMDVPFYAMGQRHVVTLEEAVLYLAILTLGAPAAVVLVAAAAALAQTRARRQLRKALYNVSAYALSAALAAAAFEALVRFAAVPPIAAGLAAVIVYVAVTALVAAGLFARLEARPARDVLSRRLALPALMQAGLGTSLGVILYALWLHSPLLLVITLPFAALLRRHVQLISSAERTTQVYRYLADVERELARDARPERAAALLLDACGDVLPSGRATLTLRASGGGDRSWTRDYDGGAAAGLAPIEAPLVDASGARVGHIRVEPARRYQAAFGEAEAELLQLIAGQASVALSRSIP